MTTPQSPIGSGFGPATTTSDVIAGIDLREKTAIVTGGTSGLGLEAAKTLAGAGALVIVPANDPEEAERVLGETEGVAIVEMELTDPDSIDAFAERYLFSGKSLDILINSAGIMAAPLERDKRGFESHLSINYLGHFQLLNRLWPSLVKADGARVVSVSSWGHRYGDIRWDDMNFEKGEYDPLEAYGQSKTADALMAVELDRRGASDGVRGFTLHPGAAMTNLGRYVPTENLKKVGVLDADGAPIIDPATDRKSIPMAAATHVWAATSPQLDGMGGVYCQDCDIAPLISRDIEAKFLGMTPERPTIATPLGVMPFAVDPERAARLWTVTEELLGISTS